MLVEDKIFNFLDFSNGFYIECGAHDGITQSNTIQLEKNKNWKGILIEPSPDSFQKCLINRSSENIFYNTALVSHEYSEDTILGDFDGSLMSSINGSRLGFKNLITVSAKTLTSILKENNIKKVDFFSLDVEGYEVEILRGLDFSYISPTYILIEIYNSNKKEVFNLMYEKNYELLLNLSDFGNGNFPNWDGTHDDYLFKLKI